MAEGRMSLRSSGKDTAEAKTTGSDHGSPEHVAIWPSRRHACLSSWPLAVACLPEQLAD